MEEHLEKIPELPTCRAKGLPICEPEPVEPKEEIPHARFELPPPARTLLCDCVFDVDSSTLEVGNESLSEENLGEPETNDIEMQLEDIRAEFEQKKLEIDQIDKTFELNTSEMPIVESTVDWQVDINEDGVDPEIQNLQQNNKKLRDQIKELERCCTSSDAMLKKLRDNLNREIDALAQMQCQIDQVDSFQRNLEHESALCTQRYRHLCEVLYDWDDCHRHIESKQKNSEKNLLRFVNRTEYKQPKVEAFDRLKQAKQHIRGVLESINKIWINPSARESTAPNARLGSEVSSFIQRNMQLFSKESH